MSKMIAIVALMAVLSSCFSARMQPSETVLGLQPNTAKVYILSTFPSDTSGIFLSTLIVQDTNNDVLAFVYNRNMPIISDTRYFADSIQSFNPKTFPVIVKSVYPDSLALGFRFSLDRDNISFASPNHGTQYQLTFPKQQPFAVSASATDFRISTAAPFDATLEELNGRTVNQSSKVALHVLDNSTPLFGQRDREHFYWLDCQINDSLTHSLFLSKQASGETTILYTTFPPLKGVEITTQPHEVSDLSISLQLVNGTILIRPVDEQQLPHDRKDPYWVGAVELIQNDQAIGTGILYKL